LAANFKGGGDGPSGGSPVFLLKIEQYFHVQYQYDAPARASWLKSEIDNKLIWF
jgi:hypothetical protein